MTTSSDSTPAPTAPDERHVKDGTVWIVIAIATPAYATGRVEHLEILNTPPQWDLDAEGQVCFMGNINGGDSVPWTPGSDY